MRVGDEWSVGVVVPAGGQQALTLLPSADRFGGMVPAAGGAPGRLRRDVDALGVDHAPAAASVILGDMPDVRSEAREVTDRGNSGGELLAAFAEARQALIAAGITIDAREWLVDVRSEAGRVIAFDVLGTPAPKGSSRAIMMGGRPQIVPNSSTTNARKQRSWDTAVREAARAHVGEVAVPPFVDTPLEVVLEFRLCRPLGHWGKGKRAGQLIPSAPKYPRSKPDIDKLVRSTLDSLIGIVFDDDSRIVLLTVRKLYAAPGDEGGHVTVMECT